MAATIVSAACSGVSSGRSQIGQLDHPAGFVERRLDQRQPATRPRIVDDDVGHTVGRADRFGEILDRGGIRKISRKGHRRAAVPGDCGSHLVQSARIPGDKKHGCTSCREAFGGTAADAARSACDQNQLASHCCRFRRRQRLAGQCYTRVSGRHRQAAVTLATATTSRRTAGPRPRTTRPSAAGG